MKPKQEFFKPYKNYNELQRDNGLILFKDLISSLSASQEGVL